MGVYHSKYSDNERVEVWNGVLSGRFSFVVGVRSSIFLPFDSLGMIIIDEEHEPSYKQFDPAPRFHARDAATMLAYFHQAKTLLGSATPSFESFYNGNQGKYGYVEITHRFADAKMRQYHLGDLAGDRKKNLLKLDSTRMMREKIQAALDNQEQVLIFQNRRGYSPYIQCEDCGWTGQCVQCDVSLTYHQFAEEMRCHYCGYKEKVPQSCPACGSTQLTTMGMGTERIEESLSLLFPEARMGRMDLDTTRNKYGYQRLLDEFGAGQIDILVGTQMITKGLDFGKVTVVGIWDGDRILNFPDFRSGERAYQQITQVAGRAGRRDVQGEVIIQTRNPDNDLYEKVIKGDYFEFFVERTDLALTQGTAVRFRVITRLAGRDFERFHIDIGYDDPIIEPVEYLMPPTYLDFAGIAATPIPCYPVSQHIAEKFHALVRPRPVESSRVKDLLDILLFAGMDNELQAKRLYAAIQSVFDAYKDIVPEHLGQIPADWKPKYNQFTKSFDLPFSDFDEAVQAVQSFINPILDERGEGIWNPERWQWKSDFADNS